jgi:hypothetical protein
MTMHPTCTTAQGDDVPSSPQEMMAAIMKNLAARSGRSEAEWAAIGAAAPPGKHGERLKRLQEEHGLGRGQAQAVLWYGERGADYEAPGLEELIAGQYAGKKAALRPVLDAVIAAALALGDGVEVGGRQTLVSFNRGRQFAIAQAMTLTSVELGLALGDEPAAGRLQPAGSFGSDRITHKVTLREPGDVDDEVGRWLRKACDSA